MSLPQRLAFGPYRYRHQLAPLHARLKLLIDIVRCILIPQELTSFKTISIAFSGNTCWFMVQDPTPMLRAGINHYVAQLAKRFERRYQKKLCIAHKDAGSN